tara:strand:+ start:65 stop:517 length:453 start_codon:yes stop_codon:yes gene_type:complete
MQSSGLNGSDLLARILAIPAMWAIGHFLALHAILNFSFFFALLSVLIGGFLILSSAAVFYQFMTDFSAEQTGIIHLMLVALVIGILSYDGVGQSKPIAFVLSLIGSMAFAGAFYKFPAFAKVYVGSIKIISAGISLAAIVFSLGSFWAAI